MPVQTERPHLGLHCLKIRHLGVTQGGTAILEDVNLHIHCGGITAVIGRNGAGKSHPAQSHPEGDSLHLGRWNSAVTTAGPSRACVSVMCPEPGAGPWLSGHRAGYGPVPDLPLARLSASPEEGSGAVAGPFGRFNADSLLDRQLGRLSGGELQRVLLGVATLPKPDLLVLDEPVSGVDQAGLQLFYQLLDRLKEAEDMVILLVSHDLPYVRRSAAQVILLDKTVEAAGTPEEVFRSAAFAHAFGEGTRPEGGEG